MTIGSVSSGSMRRISYASSSAKATGLPKGTGIKVSEDEQLEKKNQIQVGGATAPNQHFFVNGFMTSSAPPAMEGGQGMASVLQVSDSNGNGFISKAELSAARDMLGEKAEAVRDMLKDEQVNGKLFEHPGHLGARQGLAEQLFHLNKQVEKLDQLLSKFDKVAEKYGNGTEIAASSFEAQRAVHSVRAAIPFLQSPGVEENSAVSREDLEKYKQAYMKEKRQLSRSDYEVRA